MTQVQLLDKTEVWVHGVTLDDADLPTVARMAAEALGLPPAQAIVTETARIEQNILAYAARRVAVVSTGAELLDGRVKDINRAAVHELLGAAGSRCRWGMRPAMRVTITRNRADPAETLQIEIGESHGIDRRTRRGT